MKKSMEIPNNFGKDVLELFYYQGTLDGIAASIDGKNKPNFKKRFDKYIQDRNKIK